MTQQQRPIDSYEDPAAQGQVGYATQAAAAQGALMINGQAVAVPRQGFLTMAFVWMFVGVLLSAAATYMTMTNETLFAFAAEWYLALLIAEFGFVIVVSAAINRISAAAALGLFFAYALLNGLTLGIIVWAFVGTSGWAGVTSAFLGASAIFGAAALYGVVTKRDLTKIGGILFVGVIGLLVVMVVNMFLGSSQVDFLIGFVGVALFTGVTAWDGQRMQRGQMAFLKNRESASVLGALALYLDFLNIFLFMLRIFGGNRG
jgi:FtsH-binding integral membrane protein